MNGVENCSPARHWRMNESRLMGRGQSLFKYSSVSLYGKDDLGNTQEIKVRRFESAFFGFQIDLTGSGREMLTEIANQFVSGLRQRNFKAEYIQKAAFEIAAMDHELGEKFVDEVLRRYSHETEITMHDRVLKMKELGFGRDEVGNWILSANGWRKDNPEDLMWVEQVVSEVYDD